MIRKNLFPLFLLFSAIYYLLLIFRASFVIDGQRYFVLFDDMMISMRYANNFAHGLGLVWNEGVRVEGFSNLLWTLYMAIIHKFPIPLTLTSLFVQITGILCMLGALILVKKIAKQISRDSNFVVWTALIFTAFYFPLVSWSAVFGTEVSVLTLITTSVCYLMLQPNKNIPLIFFLLFVGLLTRLDFFVFAAVSIAYLSIGKTRRKAALGIIFFFAGLLIYELWRYSYYNDLLPNTYYLKATGYPLVMRIARGIYVLSGLMNTLLALIVLAGVFIAKNRYIFFLFASFAAQIIYSIYVGGDAWEFFGGANRYVALVMPVFFILFSYSLWEVGLLFKKGFSKNLLFKFLAAVFLIMSFISFNSRSDNMLLNALLIRSTVIKEEGTSGVLMARALRVVTTPRATIAVTTAGTAPYFLSDRTYIDMLGKNDKVIAHGKAHVAKGPGLKNFLAFRPGHVKWDNDYSIGTLKPDVVVSVLAIDDAVKYLKQDYRHVSYKGVFFYARRGSDNIKWNLLDQREI